MSKVIKRGTTVVFVSHNLRMVLDLCSRALLLDRGNVLALGKTSEVIETYLRKGNELRGRRTGEELFISNVHIRGEEGAKYVFRSGERAYIDIEITSLGDFDRIAIVILISNESVQILHTSTEMLGIDNLTLHKDQCVRCTFSLELHLAPGTYYASSWIYRYDIRKEYDQWLAAGTFFVGSENNIKGIANLYPRVSISAVEMVEKLTEDQCSFLDKKGSCLA
jgi:hypothetical protein